jgi:hypothetical protein
MLTGKNSCMHMNVPYTTPLKDASQSSFVYAGKIKVRYFLNKIKNRFKPLSKNVLFYQYPQLAWCWK